MKNRRVGFQLAMTAALVLISAAAAPFVYGQRNIPTTPPGTRDEKLWQKALAIHRRAIVIDTHNDITTSMTNDDYDLSGAPPFPYRTSIARMKKGGLTA